MESTLHLSKDIQRVEIGQFLGLLLFILILLLFLFRFEEGGLKKNVEKTELKRIQKIRYCGGNTVQYCSTTTPKSEILKKGKDA